MYYTIYLVGDACAWSIFIFVFVWWWLWFKFIPWKNVTATLANEPIEYQANDNVESVERVRWSQMFWNCCFSIDLLLFFLFFLVFVIFHLILIFPLLRRYDKLNLVVTILYTNTKHHPTLYAFGTIRRSTKLLSTICHVSLDWVQGGLMAGLVHARQATLPITVSVSSIIRRF